MTPVPRPLVCFSSRDSAHRSANVTHASSIGAAQAIRATALGDVEVAFVGSAGMAAVGLISGTGGADGALHGTVSTAMTTWMGSMAVVENAHLQNVTNGMATLAASMGTAELGYALNGRAFDFLIAIKVQMTFRLELFHASAGVRQGCSSERHHLI